MNVFVLFIAYLISTFVYWGWMLLRMPPIKFETWKQRLGFSAIVLKAAALWPLSMAFKLWDRFTRR